jgi:hypothetical protein
VLKHGTAQTGSDQRVTLFQFGFELGEFLNVCGQLAPGMPSVDCVGAASEYPFNE